MGFGNVLILGDSYSTFKNYIPENYATYYAPDAHPETNVQSVEQTWWHMLIKNTDSNLLLNNSWSGSTIGYIGYGNSDCSKSSSFIYRVKQLKETGFFEKNKIDTLFVFGGTNDTWCGAEIGKLKLTDLSDDDCYRVLPAMSYLCKILKEYLPNTRIIFIINTELKYEITISFFEICEHYNTEYVFLKDIDKRGGHPTALGMQQICEQIMEKM